MKNFIKIIILVILLTSKATGSFAMLDLSESRGKRTKPIIVTGFFNYPPFGLFKDAPFTSIFDKFLEDFADTNNFDISYIAKNEYKKSIEEVRGGKIDMVIGIYKETSLYNGIEYIYPSAFNNPVHIVMLNDRIGEIKDFNDLKKMKGAMHSNEFMSDYILKQMKNYDIERIDNSYDMFEKLFSRKIDFIFSSKYFCMIEASKLGIKDKITYSQKPIWNIPMFFGLSKSYVYRRQANDAIGKMLKDPENKEKINNYLIEMINNVERANIGVVPPTFSME